MPRISLNRLHMDSSLAIRNEATLPRYHDRVTSLYVMLTSSLLDFEPLIRQGGTKSFTHDLIAV